jgi:flavin reductase (DIM6/NTAB) family NADH-FMN oxidoreductase RutF
VGHKDTLANIRATGEFVINLATEPMLELVNNSAAHFAPDIDESDVLGIDMEPSVTVAVPRVASSPASLECRLHSLQELGNSVHVLGDLLHVTIADEAVLDGRPRIDRLQPISRLGANEWGLTPTVLAVDRPIRPADIAR